MTDFCTVIANLKRPKLLIHAARIGAGDYSRARDLPNAQGKSGANLLGWLLIREAEQNAARLEQPTIYSPALHVRFLTALLAESRNIKPLGDQPAPRAFCATPRQG